MRFNIPLLGAIATVGLEIVALNYFGVFPMLSPHPTVIEQAKTPLAPPARAWLTTEELGRLVQNETSLTFKCGALCSIFEEINGPVLFKSPTLHEPSDKVLV